MGWRNGKPVTRLILETLPDFCYQTISEIMSMLHRIDKGISVKSIEVILCNLSKQHRIDRRRARVRADGRGRPTTYEYKAIAVLSGSVETARLPVPASIPEPQCAGAVNAGERSER